MTNVTNGLRPWQWVLIAIVVLLALFAMGGFMPISSVGELVR